MNRNLTVNLNLQTVRLRRIAVRTASVAEERTTAVAANSAKTEVAPLASGERWDSVEFNKPGFNRLAWADWKMLAVGKLAVDSFCMELAGPDAFRSGRFSAGSE
ncbi:MAG: hypothetical protein OXI60_03470 [Acidiferrobacterales bacterium]|nr:hypothetical protein [Acidiferrobacterales bacterium]